MGRRSFISISAISRLMASSRAEERRRETDAIIANNRSLQKELSPTYSLDDVDFNEQNRIAKLSFQKTINYRTVDRYIQKNYERYPIYSGWKTKRSFIKKRIKLTNSELEKLNCNADSLIASITTDDLQAFFAAMPALRLQLYKIIGFYLHYLIDLTVAFAREI